MTQPWIPAEKVQQLMHLEPGVVLLGLAGGAWLFYKLFLRGVSTERHRNLRGLFQNLLVHIASASILAVLYFTMTRIPMGPGFQRLNSYVGLATLFYGIVVFVKTARILAFEYLFILNKRVAIPVLLVNLFTLVLSLIMAGWVATEIFNVRLTPLLATSAILSLVLGLALQDTLGNLFAGVALQFDKPYEIGDWVEIYNGSQKWIGQVNEISWRATVLIGFLDETITVSNRVMAQSEISNYSAKARPFVRTQTFRIPYGSPVSKAKEIIALSALATSGVRKEPLPFANVSELGESWIGLKLIYSIDSYGMQYIIGDRILTAAMEGFERAGIQLAPPRISVLSSPTKNA